MIAHIGSKRSTETCKNISESQKGRKAWNKGLTRKTDERVNKYALSLTKKDLPFARVHNRYD